MECKNMRKPKDICTKSEETPTEGGVYIAIRCPFNGNVQECLNSLIEYIENGGNCYCDDWRDFVRDIAERERVKELIEWAKYESED